MKNQKQTHKITKNILIAEILAENPEKAQLLSEIMIDFGIHCVGCGAAAFETLEQGVLGHGFSEEELNRLILLLNQTIGSEKKIEKDNLREEFKLKFTKTAIDKIKNIIKNEKKDDAILRISVLSGGCSGFIYNLEIINKPIKSDLNFKK